MSTPSSDTPLPLLPPKIPTSKPPQPPGNRNTLKIPSTTPTTPPPPIPPRDKSQESVLSFNHSNINGNGTTPTSPLNLITHKKVSHPIENNHRSLPPQTQLPPPNSSTSQTQLSPTNSPTPTSPLSPSPPKGRPVPIPKELDNHSIGNSNNVGKNSFHQQLHNHPLSNIGSPNHQQQSQYNTSPHLQKLPARKLPSPPVPTTTSTTSRNTINISHSELPSHNLTRQPPPLPPSYNGTLKKQNNSNEPETFTIVSVNPVENHNTSNNSSNRDTITFSSPIINNSANNIVSIVSASYPSLEHFNQFTSTRDLKVKEVLITERTYVDNMKILVEVFIEPLKAGEGGISRDHATIICSNLSDILTISVELLKGLERKIAEWSETQTIGDVFISLIPFLKMYTHYTVGYDNVMNIVSECEKTSSFTTFIQKCTEDPQTKKLDLRSYLIQPVQRITRYHMLLEEVLKHTPNTHPDFDDLQKSYLEMKKVTLDANEAIKKSENRAKVFEIQKMFVKDPEIVAAHRQYIFDGVLTKVCRKACKKRYVFLFTDLLVYGSSIPPKLLLHEKIELENCRIEDIPDGSSNLTNSGSPIINAFQIHSNKKSFVVFADSHDLKIKWMLHLTGTIDLLIERRKTIKSEKIQRSEAPVWVPDETTTNCTQCDDTFSFYNRRHHCRKCGALVCSDCSNNKFKLPISDFKPVRVCNKCFAELTQNQSTQKIDD